MLFYNYKKAKKSIKDTINISAFSYIFSETANKDDKGSSKYQSFVLLRVVLKLFQKRKEKAHL